MEFSFSLLHGLFFLFIVGLAAVFTVRAVDDSCDQIIKKSINYFK